MSTAAVAIPVARGPTRPGYWFTFRGVFPGLVAGAGCLWVVCVVLSLSSLVGLSSSSFAFYAPWVIDSPWSMAAMLGWGCLVSALAGSFVHRRMQRRTGVSLSRGLTLASVAAGGYAPWLVSTTPGGRVALSLLATPAILRVAAFERSGQPRQLPARVELSRRRVVALLLCSALALVMPFALLHPFALRGSGQSGSGSLVTSGWLYDAPPGTRVRADAGLQTGLFPVTVTSVHLVGQMQALRVLRVAIGDNGPVPGARARNLPVRIAAGDSVWISYTLALRYCPYPPASITRIRIGYRELGLALSQTVPLADGNTLLSCQP